MLEITEVPAECVKSYWRNVIRTEKYLKCLFFIE